MRKRPLVSIIMPIYNGEDFINYAIESALNQTYELFELIIVNDGSTDNSSDVINNYLIDKRIKYFHQNNRGVAAARNTALRQAKGQFIAFLDQDDIWLSDKLNLQVCYLMENPHIHLVYSRQEFIDATGKRIHYNWPTGANGYCFSQIFQRNHITILTVLLRKSTIEEIGYFNEYLSGTDDYEMWLRITLKHPIHFMNETLALYRIHSTNVSKNLFKMTLLDLATIESVLTKYPETTIILGKKTIRERLHKLNFELGNWYAWNRNDFKSANKFYLQSIKNNRMHFESYKRYIIYLIPYSIRRLINWYSYRFISFFLK